MIVYAVAQTEKEEWELGGIYTTEEKAIAACTLPTDCYWPIELDKDLGRETDAQGIFPLAQS